MKKLIFPFLGSLVLVISSCCKAGDGGDASLVVYLKHHGKIIENKKSYPDTVMVKYRSDEYPGSNPSVYDAIFVGREGENFVRINGLKCGNYFLFGAGMDSAGPYRVFGGQALEIKYSERKQEITVDLAVVE